MVHQFSKLDLDSYFVPSTLHYDRTLRCKCYQGIVTLENKVSGFSLGGCQCGGIRYEFSGKIIQLFVCHCIECRKQSASVFTNKEALCVPKGKPKFWCPTADSDNVLECNFCPNGGTRLWQQS